MKKEKKIIEIINNSLSNLPSNITNSSIVKKVPFELIKNSGLISSDDCTLAKDYIEKFELYDPKKLIKWIIDLHFIGIESIIDGLNRIQKELLNDIISGVYDVKRNLVDINEKNFEIYKHDISCCITKIEQKVKNYLDDIKEIDKLPRYKFFLRANFNKSKVTSSVQLGKVALEAYFDALMIYSVFVNERKNDNIKNAYFDECNNFIDELEISYFIAYDKEKSSFWNKEEMRKKIKNAERISDMINDYLIANQEIEIDFENDVNFE